MARLACLSWASLSPALRPSAVSYCTQPTITPRYTRPSTGQRNGEVTKPTEINIAVNDTINAINIHNVVTMATSSNLLGTPANEIANHAPPSTITGARS